MCSGMPIKHTFHDIDRYFTPFIVNKKMSHRELSEAPPEHNQGMEVIPQVLTNQAEDVLSLAERSCRPMAIRKSI